jgi:hypothetical protein
MTVDLTLSDIETLLTSVEYSKQRIRDAPDTPQAVRQENLDRLDTVAEKLRRARKSEGAPM